MDAPGIRARVAGYYTRKLQEHGAQPRGVDWNSAASQTLRFRQLLRICEGAGPFSINDYGCGYGALVDHLAAGGTPFRYQGYDFAPAMLAQARALHGGRTECTFVSDEAELAPADYTVASGVFNVKLDTPDAEWEAYVRDSLQRLSQLSRLGFAFNALTLYSDADKRRADLHYMDPREVFDYCKRRLSPRVALLHDYPLFEFTILVRKVEDP